LKLTIPKHMAVIGETQSGKTFLLNHLAKKYSGGVIVIDIEDVGQFNYYKKINQDTDVAHIMNWLKQGKTLLYVPDENLKNLEDEVQALWILVKTLNHNVLLILDEAQHYGSSRSNLFDVFSVRGLKYGVHLVTASQRIANISKTIMNNSPKLVQFKMGDYEAEYYKKYGLPHEKMYSLLASAPKYSFVIYEQGKGLSGPYRLT